jgi:hypothetical protein
MGHLLGSHSPYFGARDNQEFESHIPRSILQSDAFFEFSDTQEGFSTNYQAPVQPYYYAIGLVPSSHMPGASTATSHHYAQFSPAEGSTDGLQVLQERFSGTTIELDHLSYYVPGDSLPSGSLSTNGFSPPPFHDQQTTPNT